MATRILIFGLFIALIGGLLIGSMGLVGDALPVPADASALAHDSCALPCFFGVTPGVTTRTQAIDLLSKTVHATENNAASLSFALTDDEGRQSLASINFGADGLVDSVRLIPVDQFANAATLGDLLATQKPNHIYHTCAYMLPLRFLITFGANDELVAEVFPAGDLAPDSRITLFDLSIATSRSLYDATSSFGCTVKTDWLGLAPLWKYFTVDKPPV